MLDRFDESELLELIEGGLDARRAEALSRELDADPKAAGLIERMRRDRALLKSLEEPDVPRDLMQALEPLLARPMLLDSPPSKGLVDDPRRGRRLWPRLTAVAALIALVVLAAVWAATLGLPPRSGQPSTDEFALRDESAAARRDASRELLDQAGELSADQPRADAMAGKAGSAMNVMDPAWPPPDAEIHHHEADLKNADVVMRRAAEPAAPGGVQSKQFSKGGTASGGGFGGGGGGGRGQVQSVQQDRGPGSTPAAQTIDDDTVAPESNLPVQILAQEQSQAAPPNAAPTMEARQFIAADFAVVLPTADQAAAETAVCNAVNDLGGNASLVRNFTYNEALKIEQQVQSQQSGSPPPFAQGAATSRKIAVEMKDANQEAVTEERLNELAVGCQAWQSEQAPATTTAMSKVADNSPAQVSMQLAGPPDLMTPYLNQLQFSLQGASHTIAVPAPLLERVLEKLSSQPGQQTVLRSMRPEACTGDLQPSLPPAWVWLRDRQMVIESIQRFAQRSSNDVVLVPVVVESPAAGQAATAATVEAPRPAMQPSEAPAASKSEDP